MKHNLNKAGYAQVGTAVKKEAKTKGFLLSLVTLIGFGAFTAYASITSDISLIEFGARLIANTQTAQVVIDLYIACILIGIWMYHDAVSRRKSVYYLVPFYLITAVYACIGLLLYLVFRQWGVMRDR